MNLIHVLQSGYTYPEGPGGFQLFLEGDPDFDDKNIDVSFFDPGQPALNDDMIRNIMRKVNMMIGVKLMNLNSPNLYSNAKLTKDFFDFKETPGT